MRYAHYKPFILARDISRPLPLPEPGETVQGRNDGRDTRGYQRLRGELGLQRSPGNGVQFSVRRNQQMPVRVEVLLESARDQHLTKRSQVPWQKRCGRLPCLFTGVQSHPGARRDGRGKDLTGLRCDHHNDQVIFHEIIVERSPIVRETAGRLLSKRSDVELIESARGPGLTRLSLALQSGFQLVILLHFLLEPPLDLLELGGSAGKQRSLCQNGQMSLHEANLGLEIVQSL